MRAESKPQSAEAVDPVTMCLEEHEKAQQQRQEGSLLESRASARLCATSECPLAVRKDCYSWLDELSRQIPSVSFRVTVDGVSTLSVKVLIDDELVQTQLDGKSLELDPGPHRVRLEVPGHDPFEENVLLAEGDRFRVIDASFRTPPAPLDKPVPAPSVGSDDVAEAPEQPMSTYIFAGVGAAAAISGVAWGLSSWAGRGELEAGCAPNCKQESIDVVKRRALIADISWGVSAASLVTSMILYWTHSEPDPNAPVSVDVGALPEGGARGTLSVSF